MSLHCQADSCPLSPQLAHSFSAQLGSESGIDASEPSGGLSVPFQVLADPSCRFSLHIVGAQETHAVSVSGDLDYPLHVSCSGGAAHPCISKEKNLLSLFHRKLRPGVAEPQCVSRFLDSPVEMVLQTGKMIIIKIFSHLMLSSQHVCTEQALHVVCELIPLCPLSVLNPPQLPADLRMQSRLTLASRPAWSASPPCPPSDLTSHHSPLLPPCSSFLQQAQFLTPGAFTHALAPCLELSSPWQLHLISWFSVLMFHLSREVLLKPFRLVVLYHISLKMLLCSSDGSLLVYHSFPLVECALRGHDHVYLICCCTD